LNWIELAETFVVTIVNLYYSENVYMSLSTVFESGFVRHQYFAGHKRTKVRDHVRHVGVDMRITLRWILRRYI